VRLRAALGQATALIATSREASRAYRTGPIRAARVARRLRRTGAWEYREALEAGLLDPDVPESTRRSMISRHARREAQTRLNPLAFEPFTEDGFKTQMVAARRPRSSTASSWVRSKG